MTLNASGTTDSGKWSIEGGCFTPPEQTVAIHVRWRRRRSSAFVPTALDRCRPSHRRSPWSSRTAGGSSARSARLSTSSTTSSPRSTAASLFTLIGIPESTPARRLAHARPAGRVERGEQVPPGPFLRRPQGPEAPRAWRSRSRSRPGMTRSRSAPACGCTRPTDPSSTTRAVCSTARAVALPADGKYTFVVQWFGGDDATVTIWNAADAPAEAKQSNRRSATARTPRTSTSCSSIGLGGGGFSVQGGPNDRSAVPGLLQTGTAAPQRPAGVPTTNG